MNRFKKEFIKPLILPILVVVISLVVMNVAFGAVQEPDSNGAFQDVGDSDSIDITGGNNLAQYIASSTTDFATSSWKIKIRFDYNGSNSSIFVFHIEDNGGEGRCGIQKETSSTGCSFNGGTFQNWHGVDLSQNLQTTFTAPDTYLIDFGVDFQTIGKLGFAIEPGNTNDIINVKGNGLDEYLSGRAVETSGNDVFGTVTTEDVNIEDAFFVFSETGDPPEISDSINITFPTSTSTPPYDFRDYVIQWTQATSTTGIDPYYGKRIYTGTTSTQVDNLAGGTALPTSPADVFNNQTLKPDTTYYAMAELRFYESPNDFTPDIVATSSIVEFTTGNTTELEESIFNTPTSTATSSQWSFTCDPDSNAFTNSLCNLFRFLFVPPQKTFTDFGNLIDEIQQKPPFGYWGEIRAEIDSISTTTSAYSLQGAALFSDTLLGDVRDIFGTLLWLIFGFWLLRRISKFDFHL